jgi:hypothetical protein
MWIVDTCGKFAASNVDTSNTGSQSWALAHIFEVRYPLPTQFFSLDR